jgi:hypothetical protein
MIPMPCTFGLLLVLGGCCLGTTVSSGTGETAAPTSTGGGDASSGTTNGTGPGGPTATGTGGTGATTGSGTGSTTGACGATALTLSPNPIDFEYGPLNSIVIRCTTISSSCDLPLSLTGIESFENEGGAFAVAPATSFPISFLDGSAQVCFSFNPPITQDYMGQATLVTTDPSDTNPVVQLTGWGGGPEISCTPLTLAFGSVIIGQSSTLPVTCANSGTAIPVVSLTLGPLDAGSEVFSAAFDSSVNPYPADGLQPGQSVQIDVTYSPFENTDDFGVVAIPNNGGQKQTPYISLSGRGY